MEINNHSDEALAIGKPVSLSALVDMFLLARTRFDDNFRAMSREQGLSETQFLVLQDVAAHPGTRLLDLAARLEKTASSCSKTVEALVADGLLERSAENDDRRTVSIKIGKSFDHARFCDPALLRKIFPGFDKSSPETLMTAVQGIRALEQLLAKAP